MGFPSQPWFAMRLLVVSLLKLPGWKKQTSVKNTKQTPNVKRQFLEERKVFRYTCSYSCIYLKKPMWKQVYIYIYVCKAMSLQFPPDLPYLLVWGSWGGSLSLWFLMQGTLPVSTPARWKILPGPQQPRFVGFSRNDGWRTRRWEGCDANMFMKWDMLDLRSNTCATICNMQKWHLDILRIHHSAC